MLYRYRLIILILAAVISLPLSNFAITVDPKTECPKKKKSEKEDSVSVYESENKVLEEVEIQDIPQKPVAKKIRTENSNYNNFDNADKTVEGDPNSAMSFNFIYYIIDKFKFTDPFE